VAIWVIKVTHYVRNIIFMNNNDHIRSVIFDVDGTMFDTLPSLSTAANVVLVHAGWQEVPMSLLQSALNEGLRPLFHKAIALQSAAVDAQTATRLECEYLAQYLRHGLLTAPLFAGVSDALMAFKSRGLKLGVCTNRDRASTEALLASAAIADSFDAIVSLGDTPLPKPAPDPLLLLMERLDVSPEETLFVGDSAMDARCAQLSKVRFAAHLGGYAGHAGDLLPNVLSFGSYEQLTSWLLDHCSALFPPVSFTSPRPINLCH
jgi:phosphoglycolate phosphatase